MFASERNPRLALIFVKALSVAAVRKNHQRVSAAFGIQ
jgi:hypothetical protein